MTRKLPPKIQTPKRPRPKPPKGMTYASTTLRQSAGRRRSAARKALTPESVVMEEKLPTSIKENAMAYMRAQKAPRLDMMDEIRRVSWLTDDMILAHKLSRRQHHKALADAYAKYVYLSGHPLSRDALLAACKERGIDANSGKSGLRLVVELHIAYDGGADKKEARRKSVNLSRDVVAIQNLIKRRILPSEVVELGEQPKEGLDWWCRSSVSPYEPSKQRDQKGERPEGTSPNDANNSVPPVISDKKITTPVVADPTGTYRIQGTNFEGKESYSGTAVVEKTGDTFRVTWTIGSSKIVATGIGNNGFLAVTYQDHGSNGFALFGQSKNGYQGVWTYAGSKTTGTEIWVAQ